MRVVTQLLATAAAVAAAAPRWNELSANYTYDAFRADFGKADLLTASERATREGLFQERLRAAIRHNADPSQTWKRGINHMSDWTDEERSALRGRLPSSAALRSGSGLLGAGLRGGAKPAAGSALPASFDWRSQGVVTPVKDQGHCGSCWAFASTAVLESHLAISSGVLAELSPQELVACAPNPHHCGGGGGCAGSTAEVAYTYVKETGMASPYSFPYVSWDGSTNGTCLSGARAKPVAVIDGHEQLPANDEDALLQALVAKGPVAVSVAAEPWHDYETGVFDGCATSGSGTEVDHAVVLVGFDADSLIIRNSWTPMWGDKGYIRLKRTTACGIDTQPGDGYECEGGPSTIKVCGMCGVLSDSAYPTGARTPA